MADMGKPAFFAVDFFCGAGGTTRGLIDAGGYVVAGVDKVADCRETYVSNNPNQHLDRAPVAFLQRDIFPASEEYPEGEQRELMKELIGLMEPLWERHPSVPTLFAICAPCQPFTAVTRIELSDQRAMARLRDRDLLAQAGMFVEEFLPEMVLCENVAGIQNPKFGGVWQAFTRRLEKAGYIVGSNIVDTSLFGVPQVRKRSILMAVHKNAVRDGYFRQGPEGLSLIVPDSDRDSAVVTVRDAISHLPPLKAGERHPTIPNHVAGKMSDLNIKRIQSLQPGESNLGLADTPFGDLALDCHKAIRERERIAKKKTGTSLAFCDIYTRMNGERPAPTITTKCYSFSNGRFGHYDMAQDRGVSVREAAALQSFPDTYVFHGTSIGAAAKMVGNAVPPRLAQFLSKYLVEANQGYAVRNARAQFEGPETVVGEAEAA